MSDEKERRLHHTPRLLRIAAAMALLALALMTWSLFDPRPPPVLIAMSVGQAIGTVSFAIYVFVVVGDLRRHWKKND